MHSSRQDDDKQNEVQSKQPWTKPVLNNLDDSVEQVENGFGAGSDGGGGFSTSDS